MPRFDHVSEVILYVEDIDQMLDFYQDAFGLEVKGGDPDHGFVRFDTIGSDLCLHAGRDGDIGAYAPKVVFAVDDLETARSHLEKFDVALGEVRSPVPGTRVVDGRDPEGNKFSLEVSDDNN